MGRCARLARVFSAGAAAMRLALLAILLILAATLGLGEESQEQSKEIKQIHDRTIREVIRRKNPKFLKKKTKRNKQKISRKRKKSRKIEPKKEVRQDTCSGNTPVPYACLEDAMTVLVYQTNQAKNFMKRFIRRGNQNTTIGNKSGKKGKFGDTEGSPMSHLKTAVGGNLSDTSSCNDSASAAELVTTYNLLANCSARIQAACAQPQPNDSSTEDLLGNCKTEVDSLNTAAAGCRLDFTTDAAAQCACWTQAAGIVATIKAQGCIGVMTDLSKEMKTQKKDCIDTFSSCKKAQDAAVRLTYACQNTAEQSLNMTKIQEDAGVTVIADRLALLIEK